MSSQLQVSGEAKIRDIQGPVVANSGVITALNGAASQYVRGDGTLADFPTSTGGGSSVSYYLNSSVSQGTIGGVAYRELSKEPIIGAGTDIAISANGYVASYITDANDPDVLSIPGGNFNCEFYFSVNNNTGNPYTYAELYKYDGSTFTLLGSNVGVPEYINQGTIIAPYYFAIPVPTSALALTDRLAIRIYVNVSGRTITLHTENGHLCQVVTTLSKGMVSLNNLTDQSQNLTTGTSGTNFAIVSSGDTHTFNLPIASATNTGKLSSSDWSVFNAKQAALSFTAPLVNTSNTISIPVATSLVDGYLDNLDWVKFNTAYNDSIISAAVTGTTTKTLTLNQQDGGTITASWTDDNTDAVTSVFGRTGAIVAVSGDYNTSQVTENTNLYFTDARSRAALSFAAGSGAYNSTTGVITIPTNTNQLTNGASFITLASLSGGVGISYNNTTGVITNSAPDQTVSLTAGAGISISGTYPSFTIASTITQYTDALARAAISLTTTGTSGAATYNSTTGVLNIPQYIGGVTSVFGRTGAVVATEGDYSLTQLSDVTITSPTNGQVLKYNGTAWVNDTDANTGTVTSVGLSAPTGFSVTNSPVTSSGTLTLSFATGYSLPTNASQTTWDTAYTNRITSLTTTGSSGAATLSSNVLNIPNYTLSGLGGQPLATNLTSLAGLSYASTSFVKMTASGTFTLDTNTYQGTLTLTTTGTSGAATLVGNTLNIPQYSGGGGSISLAAIGSSPNANAATLTGSVLNLEPASASFGGVVTTGTQTFAGAKTFSASTANQLILNGGTTVASRLSVNRGSDDTNQNLLLGWNSITVQRLNVALSSTQTNFDIIQQGSDGSRTPFTINTSGQTVITGGASYSALNTGGSLFVYNSVSSVNLVLGPNGSTGNIIQSRDGTTASWPLLLQPYGGNVGIGTTAPIYKLDVRGAFEAGGIIQVRSTNAATIDVGGVLGFGGFHNLSANESMWAWIKGAKENSSVNNNASYLSFATMVSGGSPTEKMRITSSGSVGIGTTTIGSTLQVNGNAAIGYSASTAAPTNGLAVSGQVLIGSTSSTFKLDVLTTDGLMASIATTSASGGYVGWKYSTSTVYGYIGSGNFLVTGGAVTDFAITTGGSGNILFGTSAGNERMRITSGGNVGVGTTSPLSITAGAKVLQVDGSSYGFLIASTGTVIGEFYADFGGVVNIGSRSNHAINLVTNDTPRLRIDTSGNVAINTSTYGASRLQVNGNAAIGYSASTAAPTNGLVVAGNILAGTTSENSYGANVTSVQMNGVSGSLYETRHNGTSALRVGSSSDHCYIHEPRNNEMRFSTFDTIRMTISGGGVVTIANLAGSGSRAVLADSSGVLSAPVSDISVKENVKPIGYGLKEISKMNPVWFEFTDDYKNYGEGRQNGNIAQEMAEIIPEAVFTTPSTGKMGINYDQMHAVYIKAIQELEERINQLEKQLK